MTHQPREFTFDVAMDLDTVWDALTTPAGLSSWYVVEADIDAVVGGKYTLDWGDGNKHTAIISDLEPPRRLRIVYEGEEGEPSGAEEWLLSHDRGVTSVRLIHSLPVEEGATWDDTYPGIVRGWGLFMGTLVWMGEAVGKLGREATAVIGDLSPGAWERVLGTLNLSSTPDVGSLIDTTAGSADIVVSVDGYSLLLAVDDRATLLIDVEGDKLYTVAATYDGDAALLAALVEVAAAAVEAA